VRRDRPGRVLGGAFARGPAHLHHLAAARRPRGAVDRRGAAAEALIHRNVAGERIHELLAALDRLWATHAPLGVYGPTQRWLAVAAALRETGWPVRGTRARWRLGELTVDWDAVAPR
jgi:hypothetical protein